MAEELQRVKIDPDKLRAARGARSQTEVARAVGITKQQLWNIENGFSAPSSAVLVKLCLFYKARIEQFTTASEKFLKKLYNAA